MTPSDHTSDIGIGTDHDRQETILRIKILANKVVRECWTIMSTIAMAMNLEVVQAVLIGWIFRG